MNECTLENKGCEIELGGKLLFTKKNPTLTTAVCVRFCDVWCDYVIHQGISIKEIEVGGVGNNAATHDQRIATAQGQECLVVDRWRGH